MDRSATTPSLELLFRQRDWLRRLAASLAVDAAQADDLMQQALLAAPGTYTVEVFCPKFVPGTAKFTAVAGKVVEVDLVPQKDESGGH